MSATIAPEGTGLNPTEAAAAEGFVAPATTPRTPDGGDPPPGPVTDGDSSEAADTAGDSAEDTTAPGDEAVESGEVLPSTRTTERRLQEAHTLSNTALNRRYKEALLGPDGTLRDAETAQEKALATIYRLGHDEEVSGDFVAGSGNDIMLPATESPIIDRDSGKAHKFGPDELRLASIVRAEGENLVCTFDNKKKRGKPVLDSTGQPLEITVPRGDIIDALLAAEKALYEGLLEGDERAVLAARIDSLPQTGGKLPGDETDATIESAAKAAGLPTADDIRTVVTKIFPEEATRSSEVQQLLESLDGKVVMDRKDFKEAVKVLGGSTETFSRRAAELSTQIPDLQKLSDDNPTNEKAASDLAAAKAEHALIEHAHKLYSEAEARGESPFDEYFTKVQNGELNADQAKAFIQAFREGNFEGMIDQIIKQRVDLLPEQQEAERTILRKALTIGAYTLGSPLGIGALIAAIMAGLVVAGTQSLAGAGGRR